MRGVLPKLAAALCTRMGSCMPVVDPYFQADVAPSNGRQPCLTDACVGARACHTFRLCEQVDGGFAVTAFLQDVLGRKDASIRALRAELAAVQTRLESFSQL